MFNLTVHLIFLLWQSMEKTCCRNSKLATNYCRICPHLSNLISYWRKRGETLKKWWPTCNKSWLWGSCRHFSLGTGEMMRWRTRDVVHTWPASEITLPPCQPSQPFRGMAIPTMGLFFTLLDCELHRGPVLWPPLCADLWGSCWYTVWLQISHIFYINLLLSLIQSDLSPLPLKLFQGKNLVDSCALVT